MLVPLTRQKFEQIIPLIATGPQYAYCWGKSQDFLRRLLISVVAVIVFWLLSKLLGDGGQALILICFVISGLYWLWAPVYWASRRNAECRRFSYSGFLRGRVLDVFITEELIGEVETVNKRGELVIIENRERRLNLEIGDETGFRANVQAPVRRVYKGINLGQVAEWLVLSNQPNLNSIAKITDVYIPSQNLWVGEYPYLQRDVFAQVSRQLGGADDEDFPRRRAKNLQRRRP
jgi:hypothetical protein